MRPLALVLCSALRALVAVQAQLLPQPVHHWPLDEGAGVQASDISGGEHGELQPGATWSSAGRFGGAVQFNGAGGRVVMGPCDLTTGPGGISLSLWMKAGLMAGSEQVMFCKRDGSGTNGYVWSLSQVNSTAIRFRLRAGSSVTELTTPGSSLFSGSWYHVCATYDGNEMRIYLNGALMAFTPAADNVAYAPTAPACMGAREDGSLAFMGLLDDVRIYDHGLSDMDVIELVLGNVSVGMQEQEPVTMRYAEGRVVVPAGEWQRLTVADLSGRVLEEIRVSGTEVPLPAGTRASGVYVLTLWGADNRLCLRVPL